MKKIKNTTKLALQTETIKTLDDKKLEQVAGGGWNAVVREGDLHAAVGGTVPP